MTRTSRVAETESPEASEAVRAFEERSGQLGLDFKVLERSDGRVLVIELGCPNNRFYRIANEVSQGLPAGHPFADGRITLKRVPRASWIRSPETQALRRLLSATLTVDRHSFEGESLETYVDSVVGAESQITADGNHVVFGRRGSGKSSLLVYAMRKLQAARRGFAWVDMQTFDRRKDLGVVASVLLDVLSQARGPGAPAPEVTRRLESLEGKGGGVSEHELRQELSALRRALGVYAARSGSLTIFLDDLHVLSKELQPLLLSLVYAAARGNRVYLKVSAVEHFARIWDPGARVGLEPSNDAQVIRLDHNLTEPARSREHIAGILDRHAKYAGLPSISTICHKDAMARLVWVAAGVPRDAINVFSLAIGRAISRSEKSVTVSSINMVASQAAEDKMRSVELDSAGEFEAARDVLERIKTFCNREHKRNAFLVRIENGEPTYEEIRKLIDLRLLHLLSQGITPNEAGQRWMAVMLDYGFYTGIRAAKGIDLFQEDGRAPEAKDLRQLPRFTNASTTSSSTRRSPKASKKTKVGNSKTSAQGRPGRGGR